MHKKVEFLKTASIFNWHNTTGHHDGSTCNCVHVHIQHKKKYKIQKAHAKVEIPKTNWFLSVRIVTEHHYGSMRNNVYVYIYY